MTDASLLPFGRTEISADEVRQLIDLDEATKQVKKGNIDTPAESVEEFVTCIPDLLKWLERKGRQYPWRMTDDPWQVYMAEILLQRTRGDAVDKIYADVVRQFPDPETLHDATDEEIREAVRSLGFVNHRQKTLRDVAEIFTDELDGRVPDSVDGLKKPWRVGDYSARATQLFARGEPLALVDTNFARVIGRVFNYTMPQQPHKSTTVYTLLETLTPADPDVARSFNLAILDLGALVCTPDDPDCESCPFSAACHYHRLIKTAQDP